MGRLREEIHTVLGPLRKNQTAYPITGLEASLPYTMACIRENFRLKPVFTMPLWRRVGYPAGVDIGEHHIPHDVSSPLRSRPTTEASHLNNRLLTDEDLHLELRSSPQPVHLGP